LYAANDEAHRDQGSDGKKKKKTRIMITPKIKHQDAAIIVITIARSPQRSSITIDSKRTSGQKVYPLLVFLDGHQGSGTPSIIEEEDGGFPNSVTPKASDLTLENLRLYKSEDEFDSIDLGESTCNDMTAPM
ncbi:6587_t:CDS:2, partial [Acaulospora morrowiae]